MIMSTLRKAKKKNDYSYPLAMRIEGATEVGVELGAYHEKAEANSARTERSSELYLHR